MKTESALVDPEAVANAADAEAAQHAVAGEQVAFGYCTATVTVWDTTLSQAHEKLSLVERIINGQGFVTHTEDLNAVEAWLGSHPGNVYANVRRPLLHTLNLAHLMPSTAIWAGPEWNQHLDGPPLIYARSPGGTPFRLSFHDGDVGHTMIIGPTGAGKSVLLALCAVQWLRYEDAQIYYCDKGGSARAITAGVGGQHYALGGEGSLAFQPLAHIDDADERRWAATWVEGLLLQEHLSLTPALREEIWLALGNLATSTQTHRTLTGLAAVMQHNELRQALRPYTLDGPHGYLLDAEADGLAMGQWQCFEMDDLLQTPSAIAPVLTYLFHRIEQRLTGAPTLLVLDEAWIYLDHPLFAAQIREWLKTLRKLNASVIFASQSLADAAESTIAAAITESCLTRIFLPNARAREEQVARYYRSYGLNSRQIALLADATPARQYYYQGRQGNRVFELDMGPIALAFCGVNSAEARARVEELWSIAPELFAERWLDEQGLEWAGDELRAALDEKGVEGVK